MADIPVSRRTSTLLLITLFLLFNVCYDWTFFSYTPDSPRRIVRLPQHAQELKAKCARLHLKPGPPADFHERTVSDRFQPGTKAVLVRNARVWTGRLEGLEVVRGDVLLENGIIKAVGEVSQAMLNELTDVSIVDAGGSWVTPGIIDVHSHLGVLSVPQLAGAADVNSAKGPILPWLRAVDALNTHDAGYENAIAGGLTTALILPGSGNAIGGQGFVIKTRPTKERSPTAMLVEPPFNLNSSEESSTQHWRHLKHACGENPSRFYQATRMDTSWAFRQAYNTAREIKKAQDEYCASVLEDDWSAVEGKAFPENLQWEALVDVLRGRVKVQTHCYEAVDIDDFVRLTNEFQFPVAAFHHAHEAWLVPEVLKRAYEHPPAVAMFAAFARYKREAYRHSEFAPRVLADNDIDVVMKSDYPAIVPKYLIHEAAQAHYYGLPENLALASLTTTAAKVIGLDHRVGYIKPGYDADIVVWNSHPLSLAAAPIQVFIDGIPQIDSPTVVKKPASAQDAPVTPDFEQEIKEAVEYEGLPPLTSQTTSSGTIMFTNVSSLYMRRANDESQGADDETVFVEDALHGRRLDVSGPGVAVVESGRVVCFGAEFFCDTFRDDVEAVIDLQGGSLQPSLTAAGTPLGLQEIGMEDSTTDGTAPDILNGELPSLLADGLIIPRAVDGLILGTRDSLIAYRSGVTMGISAPRHDTFLAGISTAFSTGATNKLARGAIFQSDAALHIALSHGDTPSVSTEIAVLRRALLHHVKGEGERSFAAVVNGAATLAIEANSADIIATLIELKREVETKTGSSLKLTIIGGAEAHLLAHELAAANIGVVLFPPKPIAYSWDFRRVITGPPLTNTTAVAVLLEAGVTVGLGAQGTEGQRELSTWATRNLRFDAGQVLLENPGVVSRTDAFAMVSTNVEKLLGVQVSPYETDLVVTSGGDLLSFEGKVVAIISPRRGLVDFFT